MTVYIALLRGINVGRAKRVAMADLRAMFEDLGFEGARTLLMSGNVIFRGDAEPGADLERRLEAELAARLKVRADLIVRTASQIPGAVSENPFPDQARDDPSHLIVMFLKEAPAAGAVEALRAAIPGREAVELRGRELYVAYPDGIGRSRLGIDLIEAKLGTRGTGRNWNTVLKLNDLASP